MSVVSYFRNAVSELHKVTWPTKRQAVRIALIVLAVTFSFAFVFGFLDAGLTWLYELLLKLAA
jgi:preprotein translocase subunit SecE